MRNEYQVLCEVLKKDKRFVDINGELKKNTVQECAFKMDGDLLKLLLNNESTKAMFFQSVNGVIVFDKIEFSRIVESSHFLPDSYTKFLQKIVLADEYDTPIKKNTDVVIQWPHKDCVLEFNSTYTKENRNEVFLNETLMKSEIDTLLSPKVFTKAERHSRSKRQAVTYMNEKDNLLIKGNNLIAMHSLLSTKYKGMVKLMYWDILYNTASDKVPYNDSFKHSTWLTMMKNRLEVAKELLSEKG